MLKLYESHKSQNAAVLSKRRRDDDVLVEVQPHASNSSSAFTLFKNSYQKQLDNLVTNDLIHRALAINLVALPAFKKLVFDLSKMPEQMHCLSTKTATKCIIERYKVMKDEIVETIKSISFVCATADIWSSRSRSFLGVTNHIDANLMQ